MKLDFGGIVLGAAAAALSLTPSLVPRPALLQGALFGLSFALGYAVGAGIFWLLKRTIRWRPAPFPRRIAWWALLAAWLLASGILGFVALSWQNEVRGLVEMPPLDGMDLGSFALSALVVGVLSIAIGRGIRLLLRVTTRTWNRLGEKQSWMRRIAAPIAGLVATALTVLIVAGGLGAGGMLALDGVYAERNSAVQSDIAEPASAFRSAGEGSAVNWEQLGRHGRAFVGGGPSAEQIETVTGASALTPIRVYVGMDQAPSLAERARLAVDELTRTGAFDRRVLMVATSTGSGWLESQTTDALEYLQGGDTAIVSMQYAYTPSWVSFLFDQDLPVAASEALFEAVHTAWSALPPDDRPQLIAYGLSLGAHGMQSVFDDLTDVRERTDGALFVGSPNSTPLWNSLQDAREPGSPAWQPVLDDGRKVRWLSNPSDFAALPDPWETPRVAYLQHATDPVTWLSPRLLWQAPEWLEPKQRGADVSPSMRWIPVVTALHVVVDMLMGESVPASHGHNYGDVILEAWAAVTPDSGLSPDVLHRVQAIIEAYADVSPVSE